MQFVSRSTWACNEAQTNCVGTSPRATCLQDPQQALFTHLEPLAQSMSPPQVELQLVPLQTPGAHEVLVVPLQPPPTQLGLTSTFAAQAAVPQRVPSAERLQMPPGAHL
jgi:hypothetical protein